MINLKGNHFTMLTGFWLFALAFFASCIDDTIEPKDNVNNHDFYFGADLSSVNMVEDFGAVFKENNNKIDPFSLYKNRGCKLVRVRIFHNPDASDGYSKYYKPGYCRLEDVTKTIQRAKDNGLEVCLDFHYSDTWADPANQIIPLAWKGLSLNILNDSVYNYTLMVLSSLKTQNLTPEMVQLGNEIDPGMLLPLGSPNSGMSTILNSAIKAVRDFSVSSDIKPKIVIHFADNKNAVSKFTSLVNSGVTDFDIVGLSYYDQWTTLKFLDLSSVIRQLKALFKKDVMIVETSYQWTNESRDGNVYNKQVQLNGYPVTPNGQEDYLQALTQAIIDGGGSGLIYWEPAWIKSSISWGLEIQSMFDFDGNVLPSINFMMYSYNFN